MSRQRRTADQRLWGILGAATGLIIGGLVTAIISLASRGHVAEVSVILFGVGAAFFLGGSIAWRLRYGRFRPWIDR